MDGVPAIQPRSPVPFFVLIKPDYAALRVTLRLCVRFFAEQADSRRVGNIRTRVGNQGLLPNSRAPQERPPPAALHARGW